jgi:deoxyribose-phosphate aldolase
MQHSPAAALANHDRNPGVPLQVDWFDHDRRQHSGGRTPGGNADHARRSVKKEWQAAWLVNAIRCIDLTTLSGDDTPDRVARLCAKARHRWQITSWRAWALDLQADHGRGLRLSVMVPAAVKALAWQFRHPGRIGRHRLSGGPDPAAPAAGRNPLCRG